MKIAPIKIANLTIEKPIFTAPMAGFSTRSFREIVLAYGAGLAYGEMVSAQALCYGNRRTLELIDCEGEPGLHVVQLFGSNPAFMGEAALLLRELGADIIDINMGCPMPKIVNNREGAALLRQPELAAKLVAAVAQAGLPVTAKLRIGWEQGQNNVPELARRLEAAGAAMLAIHGRYRDQYYQGAADWQQIALIKQAVSIPVAGNGDIWSAADALALREQTGCEAVMVGRGMLGNPWLIAEIDALNRGETPPPRPDSRHILALALSQLKRQAERAALWYQRREQASSSSAELWGELAAVRSMRAHLGYYVKGLPGAAKLRLEINQLTRISELEHLFESYQQEQ